MRHEARNVLRALASARMSQPLVVLVGGPPAGGKSTVAEAIGRLTGLVTLHKDAFKEPLMDEFGVESVMDSMALSSAALVSFFAAADAVAARDAGVILESTFTVRDMDRIERLRANRGAILLQVHVTAATDVLMRRWNERSGRRHPGHLDAQRAAEVRARIERKTWDPLRLDAPLMPIDTSEGQTFYAASWLDEIRRAMDAAATR
ncbi:MAG: AAA family ATPase [Candidatus Dormibacteraeota bacterium]|nr:AAA family ATPase [Candidatus Dormibacteraeota bacterium]